MGAIYEDWWAAFCKDAGLKLTPKQADMATRLDFFRWLDALNKPPAAQ